MDFDFLEIGTSNFDTLIENASDNKLGISVEPIKYYLDMLPNLKNVIKVNAAITANRTDDNVLIYYIPEDIIEKNNFNYWLKGCNSINDYHCLHVKFNLQEYVRKDIVPLLNIDELLINYNVRNIKFLKIDTEGHDCIILNGLFDYLENKQKIYFPNKIMFESNDHFNTNDIDNIINRALNIGYKLQSRGEDTILILN